LYSRYFSTALIHFFFAKCAGGKESAQQHSPFRVPVRPVFFLWKSSSGNAPRALCEARLELSGIRQIETGVQIQAKAQSLSAGFEAKFIYFFRYLFLFRQLSVL
jgi:hypothetical protein